MLHLSSTSDGARRQANHAGPNRPTVPHSAPAREPAGTIALPFAHGNKLDPAGGAIFSPCRRWRYSLWRRWGTGRRIALWVMLNPSVADEQYLDPTLRRCRSFARREGCDGMVILNLFALVSTDPAGLRAAPDPVGPGNDEHLRRVLDGDHPLAYLDVAPLVVCAWGSHPAAAARSEQVLALVRAAGHTPMCLGRTASGAPRHPVRLASATPMVLL